MRDNNKTSLYIPKWYITKSRQEPKVCVKYAGPMELWNDALVTPCEGQSRRRLSPLRLSANTAMLRTACFLCVIGHRELLEAISHFTTGIELLKTLPETPARTQHTLT